MSDFDLKSQLARLPAPLRERLDATGFDPQRLVELAAALSARSSAGATDDSALRDERNRVRGRVDPPGRGEVPDAPQPGTPEHERHARQGLEAIGRGELALCVMAGGMATRMGGVVKALVEAVEHLTFLDLRLNENAQWSRRAAMPVPLWLMTSEATDAPIREALVRRAAPPHVATFTQDLGLRLTPQGQLFLEEDGQPSPYAPGHGDLPDAIRRSGLLSSFLARGGKTVWIANLDNLGATIDPALLGYFLQAGSDVLVEVAPKVEGDRGGIPVWADAQDADGSTVRRLQVLEEFRLPKAFDASAVRVFNTNTFLIRAQALANTRVRWSWFEVEKKVGGRTAVQFERLLQELTAAMPAAYIRVPRDGIHSRFLPVKDHAELEKRRGEIRAIASARGML
jgi:UTP--glucose-1-phosphate uridylyltransferase